jgi:hypothetical protein
MEGRMNEKNNIKTNRIKLVVGAILFMWAVGATGFSFFYYNKYKSIQSVIDIAGGDEFVELVEQHGESIIGVLNDVVSTRIELQSAVERTAELEQRNQRAYEYAELTNGELIEFGNAVAGSGSTLQSAIRLQQRTIEFVKRIEKYNSAIKVELGVRP